MCRFRSSNKTTIYKDLLCIWCQNQIPGCFDILFLKEYAYYTILSNYCFIWR